jgi:hypothetical protein
MCRERSELNNRSYPHDEGTPMLAEKFILLLESLIRVQTHSDGSPRVVSTSPHVPVKLLGAEARART